MITIKNEYEPHSKKKNHQNFTLQQSMKFYITRLNLRKLDFLSKRKSTKQKKKNWLKKRCKIIPQTSKTLQEHPKAKEHYRHFC